MKHRALLLASSLLMCAQVQAQSTTVAIPSFEDCAGELSQSNTLDGAGYYMYSEFYYELEDKREYAVKAVETLVENFGAGTACETHQVTINLDDIQCHNLASEMCIVPSEGGSFIVSKDYVDGTNVVLAADGYSTLPRIRAQYDNEMLYIPSPSACYSDLLNNRDGQVHGVDGMPYRYFQDLRYVLARSTRDIVSNLSESSNDCDSEIVEFEASKMECIEYNQYGSQVCALTATNGGYFQFVTESQGGVHVLFNRWD